MEYKTARLVSRNATVLEKFWFEEKCFSIYDVDPTFDLRGFSVVSATCKNLLLLNQRSKMHPIIIGLMMLH